MVKKTVYKLFSMQNDLNLMLIQKVIVHITYKIKRNPWGRYDIGKTCFAQIALSTAFPDKEMRRKGFVNGSIDVMFHN
jgi:hypothetical protein